MSENKNESAEMKEYDDPFQILPNYNKDCTELLFQFPYTLIFEIKFKNYFLSNHGRPTTNYKSIHFIINGKELNADEIQNLY